MNSFRYSIQKFIVCALLLDAFVSHGQSVTAIAAGYDHTLFVRSDGSLWSAGINVYGQLGDGTYDDTNLPEMIVPGNVTKVAAGNNFSLFLENNGSLWGMGWNSNGELGDGSNNNTNRPEMIVASNVVAIAAGYEHSLFIKRDGSLWAMGRNSFGQLGDGTGNSTNRPEMIVATNVIAVAAGQAYSLFLTTDGQVWGMGAGNDGELCDGSYNSYSSPIYITNGVKAIATGWYHTLLLMTNGSLWAAGNDGYGQLGNGEFSSPSISTPIEMVKSNVISIAAGDLDSFFIMNDGSLWAVGQNDVGQLGDGYTDPNYPNAGTNQLQKILNGGVVAVSGGNDHTVFIKNDGSLWGTGVNYGLQPTDGDFYDYSDVPVPIVTVPPAFNKVWLNSISSGQAVLTFAGNARRTYALDRSFGIALPAWIPQTTNNTDASGLLVFTNSFSSKSNYFWRVRSVP